MAFFSLGQISMNDHVEANHHTNQIRKAEEVSLGNQADEALRKINPDADSVSADEPKTIYSTGAVRSADTIPVRFTLISPIALSWVADEAGRNTIVNRRCIFNLADWSSSVGYLVGVAESQIYDFLSGGDVDNPSVEWIRKLARAAMACLMAIHIDRGGTKDYLRDCHGFDDETGRFDLLPALGMHGLAEVYKEGADKRGDMNWEFGMPCHDLLERALRHLNGEKTGLDNEQFSLEHACWNIFGAIHSIVMWPELNQGKLRKRGCIAPFLPGADLSDKELGPLVGEMMEEAYVVS